MSKPTFAGDQKVGASVLSKAENRLKAWALPHVPLGVETYHLTLLTVVWTLGNVAFGFLVKDSLLWLWGVSTMIVLQYLTDLLDGAVGRARDTGLIKWGFYMDHLLDFVFLSSLVFVGYQISPPGLELWYLLLMVVLGTFMVNSFLSFAATNAFEIYHHGVGPTETRVLFIAVNCFIIAFGTRWFDWLLPATVLICLAVLVYDCWRIHRKLWKIDMETKATRAPKAS